MKDIKSCSYEISKEDTIPTIESILDLVGSRVGDWMIVSRTSASVSLVHKDRGVVRVLSNTSKIAYARLASIGFKFNVKADTLKVVKERADRACRPWNPSQGVVYAINSDEDGEYYKYEAWTSDAEEQCLLKDLWEFYTKEDADKWVDKLTRAHNNN